MFAIEEDLDKKLWLYAIHLGKDRSEVVNDLLRPIVASMVLYDSSDRRGSRSIEPAPDRSGEPTATATPDCRGKSGRDAFPKLGRYDADPTIHFTGSTSGKSNR